MITRAGQNLSDTSGRFQRSAPFGRTVLRSGVVALFMALGGHWMTPAGAAQPPQPVEDDRQAVVSFEDGLLTVRVTDRPTSMVLRQVARTAGVRIVVYGEPAPKISIEFERTPLDDALRRLMAQYNLVFLYKEIEDPATKARTPHMIEVQVHVDGSSNVPTMDFEAGRMVQRVARARKREKRKARRRRNNGANPVVYSDEDTIEEMERLKTAAFDSNPEVRAEAVDELGVADDERGALDILERVLREDPDPKVRASAISGLEDLEEVPVEPILDAVLFDQAPEVRIGAIEIIEDQEWKDQRTVDTLSRVLNDPNEEIGLAALEVLGELGDRAALEAAARSNPHEELRVLATELLEELKP